MTWTVTSKNTVTGAGDLPYNVVATYDNTYQKGDVRQGDTAILTLSLSGAITMEHIDVYVKSNKTSGAGIFTVCADGKTVSTKSGSFKEWTGSYDNEEYQSIALLDEPVVNASEVTVALVGTTNSLHIEKYDIQYAPLPARTVTLMCGNEIYATQTEPAGGVGLNLPIPPDVPYGEFVGWSETEFWETETLPAPLISPTQKYYPEEDQTLWAVYFHDDTPSQPYATDLTSGLYMYVNTNIQKALQGVPEQGMMTAAKVNVYDEWQYYWIEFDNTASTATITHNVTGTPIGYSGDAEMVVATSIWNVYHDGEETLFYTTINGSTYVLWLDIMMFLGNEEYCYYTGLLNASVGESPMRLQPILMTERQIVYTCHPEAQAINEITIDNANGWKNEWVVPFGNYKLIIHDGQKELRVW